MPRDTFENLPKEKKERVLDAALDEFAAHTFREATVSGIVEKAGIPKGSFYQYFEDKKDLYRHLVEMSQIRKMNYMRDVLEEERGNSDVFERLRRLYSVGFRFARENPRLLAIGQNLLKEKEELRRELLDPNAPGALDLLREILREGVKDGEIDPEADLEVAAELIISYNMSLIDTFLESPVEKAKKKSLDKIDRMIYILKQGLGH